MMFNKIIYLALCLLLHTSIAAASVRGTQAVDRALVDVEEEEDVFELTMPTFYVWYNMSTLDYFLGS
jgi:hypothetical protein